MWNEPMKLCFSYFFFAFSENITAFSWEPVGNKFAVIHGDSPHINVSFYGIKHGGTVSLLSKSSIFLFHC